MLEHRGANLEIVHEEKLYEMVSIFHSLAISMWSKSTLESSSLTAYLCIHFPNDYFDIVVWDVVDQVLQLLVEIFLICILMVISRCITLDDRDFGMMSHKSHLCRALIHWYSFQMCFFFIFDFFPTVKNTFFTITKEKKSIPISED